MINNYLEFLFRNILEAKEGNVKLPIQYSERFKTLLKDIDSTGNELAGRMLWEEGKEHYKVLIDLCDKNIQDVSYVLTKNIDEKDPPRQSQKVTKFINELYNKEYSTNSITPEKREELKSLGKPTPSDILNDFYNKFVTLRKPNEFKLVKGEDIRKYYHTDTFQYLRGTLEGSCMRETSCQPFMDFYVNNSNKVNMLIMMSNIDNTKIMGRALVWNLDDPNKTFMDRIYVANVYDEQAFKTYATEQGWLYKNQQNRNAKANIVNGGTKAPMKLVVKNISKPSNGLYPYLDTIKFYNPNISVLTNDLEYLESISSDIEDILKLEDIEGGYKKPDEPAVDPVE